MVFLSFDMRGFGAWYHGQDPFKADATIDYEQVVADLEALLKELRKRYWHVPIYCTGECIGATFCAKIAAEQPSLVDGIILSSPPVRRYSYMTKQTLPELGMSLLDPNRQVDMEPFWKLFLSSDPNVVAERVNDPAGRRYLSLVDLLASNKECRKTLEYARGIPRRMPVLILQGTSDHMMKPEGAELLLSELPSTDKSLRLLAGHGHLLLETGRTSAEVKHALAAWIKRRLKSHHPKAYSTVPRTSAAS
jgi:alpha-beta hydrolase superfamily lysophospholipase